MSIDLTTSATLPAKGLNGQVADLNEASIISKVTTTALDFGVGVKKTGRDSCAIVSNAGDVVAGISVRDTTVKTGASTLTYNIGDAVGILEQGRIYASPYEDVTADAPVYARASDGRLGVTNTGAPVLKAFWEEAATADTLARLRVNIIA